MDWVWLLFSFQGRINRAKFYLAGLVILCWMIFLFLLVIGASALLGGPKSFHIDVDDIFALADPATYRALSHTAPAIVLVHLIGTPPFLWVFLASSVKRLHDRDKSGWWMVPFFVAPGLYRQFEDRLPNTYLLLSVAAAMFGLMIWGFVELYWLKGSRSANLFGPNPLGKQQARPRHAESRLRATTAYNQTSEIELVPLAANAPLSEVRPVAPQLRMRTSESDGH